MITVQNLAKYYGEVAAVRGVSFTARKGEIVGFLGPNGAGKTTTLRMLTTYLPPSEGTASVEGFDIQRQADEVRKRIGYLPETPPLYGEMTVEEYLRFVGRIKGIAASQLSGKVDLAMEKCFLTEVRYRLCQHLSRGYRQRVSLAQALVHEPDVIILDEPTIGLDPKQIIDIRRMIAGLGKDHTVILSTHILPEVSVVCQKVVIINEGRIALESPLSELHKPLEEVFLDCMRVESVN